ncbi:hypothetical protein [Dinghuibacter silviterrae]|uniref:DUF4105 domain-containing protein n=1 Tax=Dinghuibacter silviterrae TaxID=1539049 RepID=A0A4R8DEH5_9BACT|nr:hypothetical protein [Dinghuibacter silviterrae]TDW95953.1 hypothetical protein EDB95_3774 [Dinghuibacter silviterrae]
MKWIAFLLFAMTWAAARGSGGAPDSVRVLFIYGSKPAKAYEKTERKWFGGMYGGHVGMEIGRDSVLSFRSTEYPCHFFPHKKFSSTFEIRTLHGMWETFPPHNYVEADLKRVVFVIPVTREQKRMIDSVARRYLHHTPYDYATAGMRCASATYEILARAGVVRDYGRATWWKILLPRDLRSILFRQAEAGGWTIYRFKGSAHRVWEGD